MERFLHLLASTYNRLFGSKQLLPYEKLCLDSWRNSLTDRARAVLDAQLASLQFIQRQAAGAKVCFFLKRGESPPLFEQEAPDLNVATVTLKTGNGGKMDVNIYVHRGYFFSIEFPKCPGRFFKQHDMTGLPLQLAEVKTHVDL